MMWHTRRAGGPVGVLGLLLILGATAPAWAGMAELGFRNNLAPTESGSDPAAGGGLVTLTVDNLTFKHATVFGQTVDDVLEDLEAQINVTATHLASHQLGSNEITVVRKLTESIAFQQLNNLDITNTDPGFGYVNASLTAGSLTFVKAVVALNSDGTVRVEVNGQAGRAVTVSTIGKNAATVNGEIVAGLVANDFAAALQGQNIVVTQDTLLAQPATSIEWEDNDTGIVAIGAGAVGPGSGLVIPTLSEWSIVALMTLLGAAALWLMRRG